MAQIEKCSGCNGKGSVICPVCNGVGMISKKRNIWGELALGERVECQSCQGAGKLICKLCGGVGKLLIETPKTGWL